MTKEERKGSKRRASLGCHGELDFSSSILLQHLHPRPLCQNHKAELHHTSGFQLKHYLPLRWTSRHCTSSPTTRPAMICSPSPPWPFRCRTYRRDGPQYGYYVCWSTLSLAPAILSFNCFCILVQPPLVVKIGLSQYVCQQIVKGVTWASCKLWLYQGKLLLQPCK